MKELLEIARQTIDPTAWYWTLFLWVTLVSGVVIAVGKIIAAFYDIRMRHGRLEERKIELEIALLKQELKVVDPENELIDRPVEPPFVEKLELDGWDPENPPFTVRYATILLAGKTLLYFAGTIAFGLGALVAYSFSETNMDGDVPILNLVGIGLVGAVSLMFYRRSSDGLIVLVASLFDWMKRRR